MAKAKPPRGKKPPNPLYGGAFAAWLSKQPREWSMVIAMRAALRLLPMIARSTRLPDVVLPIFRATAIARFASKYPARASSIAVSAYAGAYAVTRARSADIPAYAAAFAVATADAAARALHDDRYADPEAVNDTARAAIDVIKSAAVDLAAVSRDAKRLYGRGATAEELAREMLWPFPAPAASGEWWQRLALELRSLGFHWEVWIDWYEGFVLHEPHLGRSEAEDAAFTDIPGKLPWDDGPEAVNTEIARRLQELRDPSPVQGIPSPVSIGLGIDGRITANAGAFDTPTLPPSRTPKDHAAALSACRNRAERLRTAAALPEFQGRSDYREALAAYLDWLPLEPGVGNILLADGEARVLNKLFTAEEGILATGFAGRLSVFLEDHIGLRAFYPEIENHYNSIRTGRLVTPLARDAVEGIRQAIHAHSPEVFDETVSPVMDETAKPVPEPAPLRAEDVPPPDLNRPKPPKDPIADADPATSRNFTFASTANKIWEVLLNGKDLPKALAGWHKAYEDIKPHIGHVIEWLRNNWPGGGPDSMPPPTITA